MKITIDNEGNFKFAVEDVISSLPEADLRVLSKYAVFQQTLLEGVVDALVEDHMWVDDDGEQPWWWGGDTFNNLRMKLLPLLPEMTVKAVRHLERETRTARVERDEWRALCYALQRNWLECPVTSPPTWAHQHPLTREEVLQLLERLTAKLAAETK